jgi:hypothetical protein
MYIQPANIILSRTTQIEAFVQTKNFSKAMKCSKSHFLCFKSFKNFLVYHTWKFRVIWESYAHLWLYNHSMNIFSTKELWKTFIDTMVSILVIQYMNSCVQFSLNFFNPGFPGTIEVHVLWQAIDVAYYWCCHCCC